MPSLIKYIQNEIDPEEYYKIIFPDAIWSHGNEARVLSPFIDEKTPSFSINRETGKWYSFCKDDQRGGNSIISFQAALDNCRMSQAAKKIYHRFIHPIILRRKIRKWNKYLEDCPSVLRYLKKRCISKKIIKTYNLGWNGKRIIIPIYNEFDLCINAKLYNPDSKSKSPKVLNYTMKTESRSFGSPVMLYPMAILNTPEDYIIVCEGEWDVLSLLSMGIPAITTTGGARTWPKRYNHRFKKMNVIVIPDNDDAGVNYKELVIKNISHTAHTIKTINIPKKYGKDVNDFIISKEIMRKKTGWMKFIGKAERIIENPERNITKDSISVSLDEATSADLFGRRITISALITGKGISPYLLPKKYRLKCDASCNDCSLAASGATLADHFIDPKDPYILDMTDRTKPKLRKMLLSCAGVATPSRCSAGIQILETFNLEYLLMIPTLNSNSKQYVTRFGYYLGHGLKSNRTYQLEGIITPNPKDQVATFLFDNVVSIQNEIETFKLSTEVKDQLKIFRPNKLNHFAHMIGISEWQSRNITKIFQRPDLHIAVDLAYHSVQGFKFNQEFIPRGMLDILILGDTRCGKGFVTERLQKYYGLGEVASGENCSFAGLIGGIQQIAGRWLITWGLIPLNHNRLVVIDEMSSLTEADISKLSRVRSEGVAEISKIIRESTQANTRLIWLSNPRSGRPIITYNTGIEALKELIGANEDISRFDFAITVASNEVDTEIINSVADYDTSDYKKYSAELCRNLLLWCWSREPDQIKFTEHATKSIIEVAKRFGEKYSSTIPLVQIENIRIKLAKISAAIAARTFSTDARCEKVIITHKHVKCTEQFLTMIYSKASMGYDTYSKTTIAASKIEESGRVEKIFRQLGTDRKSAIVGLLELHQITTDNLSDYVGDIQTAKILIGDLVRARCIVRYERSNWYLKNPAFSSWLKSHRKKKGF